MSQGYVINVGRERPEEVIVAHVKKNGEPVPDSKMTRYVQVGKHLIGNQCRVWGKRIITDDAGKDKGVKNVEITTPGYTGKIKTLPWNDPDGHALSLRYLENSRSLDVDYQNLVQKITVDPVKGGAQLELNAGENKFDKNADALLIDFLKAHPQNRDSISKNPNPEIKGFSFYEKTDDMMDKQSITEMEAIADAGFFVKQLSAKPSYVNNVFNLMVEGGVDFGNTNHLSTDGQRYQDLLRFASTQGVNFMAILVQYRAALSESFVKADSFNVIDFTKDGVIALTIDSKKEVVFKDIPEKGEKMQKYIFDRFYEDEIFEGIQNFKLKIQKL